MTRSLLTPLLSILALLALWQAVAVTANSALLPPPGMVFDLLGQEILSGRLPHHLGITLARLGLSFTIALLLGTVIGIALGRHARVDRFFDSWLVIALNIPALVTIILCYVWFGLVEAAARAS